MEWSSPWASASPTPLPGDIKDETGKALDTLVDGTVWDEGEGASAFEPWSSNVNDWISPQWRGEEKEEDEEEGPYTNNGTIATSYTKKELDNSFWDHGFRATPTSSPKQNAEALQTPCAARNDSRLDASTNAFFTGSYTTSSEVSGQPTFGKTWEEAAPVVANREQCYARGDNDEGGVALVAGVSSIIFPGATRLEPKVYTLAKLKSTDTTAMPYAEKDTFSSSADGEASEGYATMNSNFGHASGGSAAADVAPVVPKITQDEGVDTRIDSTYDIFVDFGRNRQSILGPHVKQLMAEKSRRPQDEELQPLVVELDETVHVTLPRATPSVDVVAIDKFLEDFVVTASDTGNDDTAHDLTPALLVSSAQATTELFPKPLEEEFDSQIGDSDLIASTTQRKAWYMISRTGTMREYESNGIGSYVRVNWTGSAIRARVLETVAKWTTDDPMGFGNVNFNGYAKSFSAVNFKWAAAASPVQEDVPKLTKEQVLFVENVVSAFPDLSFMYY